MARIIEKDIESLVPDSRNFNRGTEYGERLLEKSLHDFGIGRSILIDRNDRIIAGNKTHQKAVECGFTKCVVVETDGNTLVAVKRRDVDLDSAKGRELALADNAVGKANLEWDAEAILEEAAKFDIEPGDWGVSLDDDGQGDDCSRDGDRGTADVPSKGASRLIVECADEVKLSMLFDELRNRGFEVSMQ